MSGEVRWTFDPDPGEEEAAQAAKSARDRDPPSLRDYYVRDLPRVAETVPAAPVAPSTLAESRSVSEWFLAAHDHVRSPARLQWQTRSQFLPPLPVSPELSATEAS